MKLKMSLLVLGLVVYACTQEVSKDTQSLYNILFPSASRASTPTATLPGSDKVNISGKITGLGTGKWVKIKAGNSESTFSEDKNLVYFFLGHPKGTEYKVEVIETSLYLDCSIANATGTPTEDVNNVDVTCAFNPPLTTPTYTVGGTVTGLTGNITLNMTGSVPQTKTISANGTYIFDTTLLETQTYDVTISVHSNTSFCFLVNANASNNMNQTGTVGTSNITNVNIQCVGRLTLNEAISNQNASCASNSADYIELKNISGVNVNIGTNEWYLCDDACGGAGVFNSSATPLFAIPPQTFNNNTYLQYTQNAPGSFTFGLGSADAINLIYVSGGKNYLVEKHSWSAHVIPARKSPDGAYNGSIAVTSSQPSWINENAPANCTKGTANP